VIPSIGFFTRRIRAVLILVAVAGAATACGYLATITPAEDEVSVWLKSEPEPTHEHPVILTPRDLTILLQSVRVTFKENWIQRLIAGPLGVKPLFDETTMFRVVPGLVDALTKAGPRDRVVFYISHRRSEMRRDVTSGTIFVKGGLFHLVLANYQNRVDVLPGIPEYDRQNPEIAVTPQHITLAFERPEFLGDPEQGLVEGVFGAAPPQLLIDYVRFIKMTVGGGTISSRR
jgi:hypothetical protein